MEEKKNAFFTSAVIAAIILIFTVADLCRGDRLYSETENRILAARPAVSRENILSGKYAEDYEAYVTDQFVSRDKWIGIKTRMDILLQKKEINGVYLGADGYLIEQHLPEDYSGILAAKRMVLLQNLIDQWDAVVMLAPTADNILTDKMPANAPYYDQAAFLERVAAQVGEGHYVDVYGSLKAHMDEEIYYRSDHHWTSLGAYYGYLAWAEAGGEEPYAYRTNAMTAVSGDFLGTLHSKTNLEREGDVIRYFEGTEKRPVTVTYDFDRVTDTFYETSYLDTKNQYGFFLDDNHAFIQIDTSYRNGKTLFVIKDSYANSMIPLLTPHYERIYVVDPRYYNGRLSTLMKQMEPEGGMDVLVLYNCIHFLEEFSYL
ncbi:MAG: DHHW family protein [Blautia sp.]|nr:DHHW family protein [Blautia sp.]